MDAITRCIRKLVSARLNDNESVGYIDYISSAQGILATCDIITMQSIYKKKYCIKADAIIKLMDSERN